MLVLMPPPDVDKPEGMEMSDDPEEAFHQMFRAFFGMMDLDGNGELSADELSGWVHPAQHMDGMDGGPGMPGGEGMHKPPPMDGDMGEHVRRLERELRRVHHEQQMRHIEEMTHHRDRLREEHAHMLEEQQRMAEHMREMEEEARRVNEELERANSEPPISREPPMGDEN